MSILQLQLTSHLFIRQFFRLYSKSVLYKSLVNFVLSETQNFSRSQGLILRLKLINLLQIEETALEIEDFTSRSRYDSVVRTWEARFPCAGNLSLVEV